MVCCGIVGRGACIQSVLFSVLLVLVFPFLSSREFSRPTSQSVLDVVITLSKQSFRGLNFILTCNFHLL